MKNNLKFSWFRVIEIVLLTWILAFVVLLIVYVINQNKNKAYDYLPQCVCVNVEYTDETSSSGTAVLINNMEAISVAHLFEKSINKITCHTYNSHETFVMEVLKLDTRNDLAKLKIIDFDGVVLEINYANKTEINYAKKIVKFGNALGYGITASEGTIANPYLQMEIDGHQRELINISLSICGGDSGGGVFSKDGKFIGIMSFKITPSVAPTDSLSYIVPSYIILDFLKY